MSILEAGRAVINILPGKWYATNAGELLTTVLGSCVSVCLRDGGRGVAGMNHFMLVGSSPAGITAHNADARYGTYSMELLINDLLKLGARRQHFQAKVFGGATILDSVASMKVGEHNATFATCYLQREEIPIVGKDLGGPEARKIVYDTQTGDVYVRHVHGIDYEGVVNSEISIRSAAKPHAGSLDLFE